MKKYRISKYSPIYRDERGRYLKDDWTSYADIGKKFNGNQLTLEEYINVERNYQKIVKRICEECEATTLVVKELERGFSVEEIKNILIKKEIELSEEDIRFITDIKNGYLVSLDNLRKIVSFILKDCFWCKLECPTSKVTIEFGYDLYVYITCNEISKQTIQWVEKVGMYIESI